MSEEKKPTATLRPGTFSAQKNAPAQAAVKTAGKKTAAGKTAAKKTEEVKEEKKEEKKVAQTQKTAAKTAETKTAAAKKPSARKSPAKKPAAAKKSEALKAEVILQHNGNEYTEDRLVKSAQDVWQFDLGRDLADFKSVTLYVKPEEGKVYGVVNGTEELSFNI